MWFSGPDGLFSRPTGRFPRNSGWFYENSGSFREHVGADSRNRSCCIRNQSSRPVTGASRVMQLVTVPRPENVGPLATSLVGNARATR